MYAKIKVRSNPALERNYLFAEADFLMALASERCALPQTTIDKYITNIYLLTGIDPNCECGCSDGVSQPLVPTSSINGTDGTDGSKLYNGTTVPSNGLGVVGDYYIRTTNGFLYEKTGATTWTYVMTLVGATGATGATGASGTSLIYSGPVVSGVIASVPTTTNGSYETLSSFSTDHTNDAKNLVNVGDTIKLSAIYKLTDSPTEVFIFEQLLINGTGLSNISLVETSTGNASDTQIEFNTEIVLKDDSAGAMYLRVTSTVIAYQLGSGTYDSVGRVLRKQVTDIGGATVDFSANDYTISAQARSVATGDISLQIYQAEKLAIANSTQSPSTSIKYITPFTTTASVQSYANVVGNAASNIVRVYLDGVLLTSADWTYTQATDTLLFNISITGASEVAADYV